MARRNSSRLAPYQDTMESYARSAAIAGAGGSMPSIPTSSMPVSEIGRTRSANRIRGATAAGAHTSV